jgi:hypothetical protein
MKPLQDKDHHGEILKTMKGAQGLSRMWRLEEQKDGEIKEKGVRSATEKTSHSWAQLARQEKLPQDVWYHHSSMTKDTLWTKYGGVCQLLNSTSEGPGSTRTHTLSKMLPASTINASLQTTGRTKNMGDTISRGAVIKVSILGSDDAPKEWT